MRNHLFKPMKLGERRRRRYKQPVQVETLLPDEILPSSGKRTLPQVEAACISISDDILICILGRLDVRDIVRYRCVWKDIMSDQQFVDSQLRMPISNIPMILARSLGHNSEDINFSIDNWWETKAFIHKLKRGSSSSIGVQSNSQNGFILTKETNYEFIISNPLTGNQVTIFIPTLSHSATDILGIFLHPIRTDQYCTLWAVRMKDSPRHTQYKMLDLGSGFDDQPTYNCWRNIGKIWRHWVVAFNRPLCLDGFLCWMVEGYGDTTSSDSDIDDDSDINDYNDSHSKSDIYCNNIYCSDIYRSKDQDARNFFIIAFDIKTEEFTEIPLPGSNNGEIFTRTNLLNVDGCLSLVKICLHKDVTIKIWTMKICYPPDPSRT